jgi:glycosyltransferase involved in cell wall biosynthesis
VFTRLLQLPHAFSMSDSLPGPVIRLLVLLEGTTVTGPAKNLLEFCRVSRSLDLGPRVEVQVAVFVRGHGHLAIEGGSNELLAAAEATGLEVHCLHERFPFDPQVIRSLRKLVKCLAPDIIQTHFVKSHFLVRISRVWRLCRWIAFHHGYTTDACRTVVYNQLDRWSMRVPQRIITVCEPFKKQLSSRGIPSSRIRVLHNSISLDWLGQSREIQVQPKGSGGEGDHVVLAVGRLSKEKGLHDLVAAMDKLQQLRPDFLVQLLIVGDGPERKRLERGIKSFRLKERVKLVGHVRDVRPYYASAHVLAISSSSEGSPNALLEAMAAGVPVVATSVGGIPEIVTNGETALFVRPHNPEEMASAINLVLSNAQLSQALVRNARERIKRQHSPQSRARFLVLLYAETMGAALEVPA